MNNINYEYIQSRKGSSLILFENYLFKKDKVYANGTVAYVCRSSACKVRGTLSDNNFTIKSAHDHVDEEVVAEVMRTKAQAVKSAIDQPTTSMKRLHANAFANVVGEENDVMAPAFKSLKSSMYRCRAERLPKQPRTLADIDIVWRVDAVKIQPRVSSIFRWSGEQDAGVFTIPFLRLLATATNIYMDGTFHVAAHLFYQLDIIYVFSCNSMIPVCYALLPDKTEATYKRLFRLLQQEAAQFNLEIRPTVIQVDFEKAVINAIGHIFPYSSIRGCYFHFTQSIWRAVQRHGLVVEYREDDVVGRLFVELLDCHFCRLTR